MSIWKELYDTFDKERAKWQADSASKQSLVFELKGNLTFLADALQSNLSSQEVLKGLERATFDLCMAKGFNINSISGKKIAKKTIGEFDEFKKYLGKDTEYLVNNAYLKIGSLTKLVTAAPNKDHSLKFKSLFRFLVLLVAHLDGRTLRRKSIK